MKTETSPRTESSTSTSVLTTTDGSCWHPIAVLTYATTWLLRRRGPCDQCWRAIREATALDEEKRYRQR